MSLSKKSMLLALATLAFLVLSACSNSNHQSQRTQTSQSSSSLVSSSSANSTSSSGAVSSSRASSTSSSSPTTVADSTELEGTYVATYEGGEWTLTLSADGGTLTKVDSDGEEEVELVEIDTTNQSILIGDDVHRYYINGNQLTVEDIDQEQDQDDTIVFTKQ